MDIQWTYRAQTVAKLFLIFTSVIWVTNAQDLCTGTLFPFLIDIVDKCVL